MLPQLPTGPTVRLLAYEIAELLQLIADRGSPELVALVEQQVAGLPARMRLVVDTDAPARVH